MKCFFFKIMISHVLDHDRPLPQWIRNHALHCSVCRRFYKASAALPDRLRTDDPERSPDRWTALGERVMETAAIRSPADRRPGFPARGPVGRWSAGRMAAVAACLTALLVGGWLILHQPDPEPRAGGEVTTPVKAVSHLGRQLIDPIVIRGEDSSLLSFVAEPLFAEAERLAMDARSLGGFVMTLFPMKFLSRDWDG